jgi:hypothetical protein
MVDRCYRAPERALVSSADMARAFAEYHEASYTDGVNDGRVGDLDDVLVGLPRRTHTITECEAICTAYVAGFDFEDMADQYDHGECIPEIAWQEWCRGFAGGLAEGLYDYLFRYWTESEG